MEIFSTIPYCTRTSYLHVEYNHSLIVTCITTALKGGTFNKLGISLDTLESRKASME